MAHEDKHQLGPLLDRSVRGDADAVNALLGRLRPYLHALVRQRLGADGGGALDASSLVQRSLLKIYKGLGGLREHTVPQLLNWVGRIVRNVVIDAFRHDGRRPCRLLGSKVHELLAQGLSPAQQRERDERAVRVAAALARLPPRQRQVLELRFLENLSDAEICRRLGGSEGAVRVLRFRALQQLKRLTEATE